MSTVVWSAAAVLLAAAVLVAGPLRGARARRRAVAGAAGGPRRAAEDPLVGWIAELGRTLDGPRGPLSGRDAGESPFGRDASGSSSGRDIGAHSGRGPGGSSSGRDVGVPSGRDRGGSLSGRDRGRPSGRDPDASSSGRDANAASMSGRHRGGAPVIGAPAVSERTEVHSTRVTTAPAGTPPAPGSALPAPAAAPPLAAPPGRAVSIPDPRAAVPDGGTGSRAAHVTRPGTPYPSHRRPGPGRPSGAARPPGRRDSRGPAGLGGTPSAGATVGRRWPLAAPQAGARTRWANLVIRAPRRALILAALAGAGAGGLLAGPVAAVALAAYGAIGVRAAIGWQTTRRAEQTRRQRLDALCGLAADLRAGLPATMLTDLMTSPGPAPLRRSAGADAPPTGPGGAMTEPQEDGTSDRLDRLASAAVRLADRTGAPLADLLERIEADARSTDRGLAAAAAQAAGARATAWLLAALPLGGIGLGYGIGVDPVQVLLHTPVGAMCTVLAVALQAAGLFWAERLGAPGRAA